MDTIVIRTKSKKNLKLIVYFAKKLGVDVSVLSKTESEEVALSSAIKEGRSNYQVDTNEFVKSLETDFWDELSELQKEEIEIAISELDSGEGISWDEFRKQVS